MPHASATRLRSVAPNPRAAHPCNSRPRPTGLARAGVIVLVAVVAAWPARDTFADGTRRPLVAGHPRLYFNRDELPQLRCLRTSGVHAKIWANLIASADWCAKQTPRHEWIPTVSPDPKFENLYDRFYAAMHDMAIIEHLAFASVLSDPRNDPYFAAARRWAVQSAATWKNEADNQPDASKAYAVLRVMKALAVAYDLLYERLDDAERAQIRNTLVSVCSQYFVFFAAPKSAGPGYNKHHGSVDAAPMGVVALALLGEVPQAGDWLDRMIEKHVDYLLPFALTPSGTNEQSSNFWASTIQYRIFFLEALRRVTGRNLFAEFPDVLPGRIALAAVAGKLPRGGVYNEAERTVLFAPCYGQIDYWAPALLFLAREQKRPIYQHLALWDESLGKLQRTRFVTPTKHEELLFSFGGYAYVWCDPTIPDAIEQGLPRAFEFHEPEVNEAYLRDSYRPGGLVVGMKKGAVSVHAAGRPVFVDRLQTADANKPAPPVADMLVADDGRCALIRCVGPEKSGLKEQRIELCRPGRLTIRRELKAPLTFWYSGEPTRTGNTLKWSEGAELTVLQGTIETIDPQGYVETKVHFGGMKFADPHPFVYPVVTVLPDRGVLKLIVTVENN